MKIKLTPVNYLNDLEKIMQDEECEAVGIERMSITYIQPADTCSSSDDIQTITITTQCGECCGIEEAEKKMGATLTSQFLKDGIGQWVMGILLRL